MKIEIQTGNAGKVDRHDDDPNNSKWDTIIATDNYGYAISQFIEYINDQDGGIGHEVITNFYRVIERKD